MPINADNYREYLLRWLDDDLSQAERTAAETYVLCHAEAADEWRRLQQTRLKPKEAPVFPFKERLFRQEEEPVAAVVVPLTTAQSAPSRDRRRYWAAAAIAAGLALGISFWQAGTGEEPGGLAGVKQEQSVQEAGKGHSILNRIERRASVADAASQEQEAGVKVNTQSTQQAELIEHQVQAAKLRLKKHSDQTLTNAGSITNTNKTTVPAGTPQVAGIFRVVTEVNALATLVNGQRSMINETHRELVLPAREKTELALSGDQPMTAKGRIVKAWSNLRNTIKIRTHHEEEGTFLAISVQTENLRINRQFRTQ